MTRSDAIGIVNHSHLIYTPLREPHSDHTEHCGIDAMHYLRGSSRARLACIYAV